LDLFLFEVLSLYWTCFATGIIRNTVIKTLRNKKVKKGYLPYDVATYISEFLQYEKNK
jgi:hypothetical protein